MPSITSFRSTQLQRLVEHIWTYISSLLQLILGRNYDKGLSSEDLNSKKASELTET